MELPLLATNNSYYLEREYVQILFIEKRTQIMEFKKIKLKGTKGTIRINEDGSEVFFNDKLVNQYHIKSSKHSNGYKCCSIKNKQYYIHRIVAEAWVNNKRPVAHKLVIHKDCNTLNNHHSNLTWGNNKTVYDLRVKQNIPGAGVSFRDQTYRGGSKISYEEAIRIAQRLDNGETANTISKEYGVSEMSIIRIRKRYCKNKVASPRYSNDIKSTVVKLREKHPPKRISEITGIRYETVLRWCKQVEKTKVLS